jgi:hypothetical protein
VRGLRNILVRSYLMTSHTATATTANTPTQIDVAVASKSRSQHTPAVVRLVAGCNFSTGTSFIWEGSQTLAANAAAIVAPIPLQGLPPKR